MTGVIFGHFLLPLHLLSFSFIMYTSSYRLVSPLNIFGLLAAAEPSLGLTFKSTQNNYLYLYNRINKLQPNPTQKEFEKYRSGWIELVWAA